MELFYREYGEGQPLVILHGLFGMSDNWVTLARRLAANFHVYLPDLRNHGQSPHSAHHSYEAMAGDLDEFLGGHNIQNPLLMGHSMGGKVAMLYATEHPAEVDKLVVVDISPKTYPMRGQHLDMLQLMMDTPLAEMKSRLEAEAFIALREKDERIRLFILKNLYRPEPGRLAWRVNLPALHENLNIMLAETPYSYLFEKPSLFIRGALSDYISDDDIPLIHSIFPVATVVAIGNSGHWVHADQPVALCQALSEFTGKECTYS